MEVPSPQSRVEVYQILHATSTRSIKVDQENQILKKKGKNTDNVAHESYQDKVEKLFR